MHLVRSLTVVTGAWAPAAATAASASAGSAVSAVSDATSTDNAASARQAEVAIHPGVLHVGWAGSQPPTTAECEADYSDIAGWARVISQSFSATEETFPSTSALAALRGAYIDAYRHHVTVLTASGDSGAADVGLDQTTYYTHPVTSWPDSDPLVTGVGGTQLHLNVSEPP